LPIKNLQETIITGTIIKAQPKIEIGADIDEELPDQTSSNLGAKKKKKKKKKK